MSKQENKIEEIGPKKHIAFRIVLWLIVMVGLLILYARKWALDTYGEVPFEQVLFHIVTPTAGAGQSIVWDFIKGFLNSVPAPAIITAVALSFMPYGDVYPVIVKLKKNWEPRRFRFAKLARVVSLVAALSFLTFDITKAWKTLGISVYLDDQLHPTHIYEEYYADPAATEITFPEKKKNLIYIFCESMENSCTSFKYGGAMSENLMPELTKLTFADGVESFRGDSDYLNGAFAAAGATWTVGAMVAQTAGIPLSLPLTNVNGYGAYASFLPGATSLGDLLAEQGYTQQIMMGSKATFGGRNKFFEQHGNYMIYDYRYAVSIGKISEDYYENWGYEDAKLFEYAKEEVVRLAAEEEPFNLTLLTVDNHFPTGYHCELCGDTYITDMENAIACDDAQIVGFVEWLQQQDFYEDTVIVIAGDHPNMGNVVKKLIGNENYSRKTYFAIVNSETTPQTDEKRLFSTMDLFPTTLAALGCTIEGDRLGLGTNLYSTVPTLVEELGLEQLNAELAKSSKFYDNQILK